MASRKSKKRANRGRPMPRPVPDKVRETPRNAPEKELAGLKPKPASNERVEDIAVFSNVGREQLSDALRVECIAVMESLDAVSDGNFDQANERLKNIARSSPYADWRLFVRGLCGFYAKDFETAKQNWQRLEANRRPARIAATLVAAELNQELANFTAPPKRLIEAARTLLHRSSAVAAAKQILSVKHRDSEIRFSPSQVAMLTNFRDDFRRVDADFVAKFSQACVYLSCTQPMPDTFMLLKKSVPGPPHDPRWNLQEFLYMRQFDDIEEDREATAKAYIENDLPSMTQFSKEQKAALASCIQLDLARMLDLNASPPGRPFFYFDEPPDYKAVEKLLGTAIKSYQKNREAHRLLFDILNRQIESQQLSQTKAQIEAAEKRLIKAKEAFVSVFPGEIETSLALVDHYFSQDQLDKADALVKQLSSQRLDAPLAKALPWKLKLLGAMHNSRKKAELNSVRESLAIADAQWPSWLARTWLPFIKAALELRVGNRELFESLDRQARQDAGTSQVACDFMAFAAIQQMNVPPAVMKPFRETVTKYLAEVEQLPLSDLVSIGAFFWDLSRTGLEHKAFRLQASKVGKAICSRLKDGEKIPHSSAFIDASCFCAARGFWKTAYESRQPPWAEVLSKTEPKLAAAFIGWVTKSSYAGYSLIKLKSLIESLQEAAKTERDPFYRYRFEQVALSANEAIAEYNRGRNSPGMMGPFFDPTSDDEPNEDCQCPKCRAKRAQEAARNSRSNPTDPNAQTQRQQLLDLDYDFFDDELDDEDDDEFDDEFDDDDDELEMDFGGVNPEFHAMMAKIASRIGLDRMEKFAEALGLAAGKAEREPNPAILLRNIVKVFKQFGLPGEEAVEFVRVLAGQAELENSRSSRIEDQFDDLPGALPAQARRTPMTAEERKAADKKRRRELEKKKKRR